MQVKTKASANRKLYIPLVSVVKIQKVIMLICIIPSGGSAFDSVWALYKCKPKKTKGINRK